MKIKQLKFWDSKNNKLKSTIYGQIDIGYVGRLNHAAYNEKINNLAVSGDFAQNQENYEMYKIRIYDMNSNKIYKTIENKNGIVSNLEFSSDGKFLVTGFTSPIYHFSIYETSSYKIVDDIKIVERYLPKRYHHFKLKIIQKKDDYLIITVSELGDIDIYSKKQKKFIQSLNIKQNITALYVDDDFIYVGFDGGINKYDVNLNLLKSSYLNLKNINIISKINEEKLLICSVQNCYTFNKETFNLMNELFKSNNSILSILQYDDNTMVSSLGQNDEISFIDSQSGKIKKKIINNSFKLYSLGLNEKLLGFSNNFDVEKFDTYIDLDNIKINKFNASEKLNFDTELPKNSHEILIKEVEEDQIQNRPTKLKVINKKDDSSYEISKTPGDGYVHAVYGLNDNFIISGSAYGMLNLYNSSTGNKIGNLIGHNDFISGIVKNDKFIFTSSYDGVINAWDLQKLKQLEEKKVINEWKAKAVAEKFGTTKEEIKKYSMQLYLNYGIDIYSIDIRNIFPTFSIYIINENEFVIWTEEGYFTVSSEKALKYITWHMNQGFDKEAIRYDIGKFYDVFFRPDLVKLKLKGEDISKYTDGLTVKDALRNPPPNVNITNIDDKNVETNDVTLNTDKDIVKVRFNVSDFGGGVGNIRVYQEGKLIKRIGNSEINKVIANVDTKKEEKEKEQKLKEYQYLALSKAIKGKELKINEQIMNSFDRDLNINNSGDYEIMVPLKKGLNQISVEAFNNTNTITSFRSTVNINANIPEKKAKLYAIVAGVNNFESSYGNELENLRYSVNDANQISQIISETKGKIFEDIEIIKLTDNHVTKDNLNKAFYDINQKASLEDTILFYISTHGKSVNGKFYLFPSNNLESDNLIEFNEIFTESSKLKSLNQVFIIDACQSGSANDIASSVYDSRASVLARSSGIHLLSASTSGTKAFENDKYKHSNFTYEIISALKNKEVDINKDNFISIIELSNTLKRQNTVEKQFPVIQNIGNDININEINSN
ncbi:caspase family protein [Aliarcobacter cryaerophilus]|uniref:Caspase family protein n=1 Tax=Aliarcobacter cryaerophilus TaxID=28198 RepID=A0AA46NQF4_9BACT|nr:caspase family protein [Aliarcobacter cryaerophilus]UYF42729.1 caspase family protein [Aliarcobacter cryaerophilus]